MNDLIPMVTERDGVPITTSRAVAEQFGKRHSDILRAIETTVEQLNETEAGEGVASLFLQALKDALAGGDYYIRDKWKKPKGKEKGHLLGIIDGCKVCVKSWQAYKIYSSAVPAPMKITTLWGVLEEFKAIAPREEVGKQRSIDKKRVGVIYIDADKLLK